MGDRDYKKSLLQPGLMDMLELNLMGGEIVRIKRKSRQEDIGGGCGVVALTTPSLVSTPVTLGYWVEREVQDRERRHGYTNPSQTG